MESAIQGFSEGHGAVNEDAFALWSDQSTRFAIVADGAGGSGNGQVAAKLAVATLLSAAKNGRLVSESALLATLHSLDADLELAAQGGLTTAVVAIAFGAELLGAAVGDSVAWTLDVDGQLVNLTESTSRKPLLGSGRAIASSFRCRHHQRLLLMTDGAYRYVPLPQTRILFAATEPGAAADAHFAAIRTAQGQLPDDATVVMLDPQRPASGP